MDKSRGTSKATNRVVVLWMLILMAKPPQGLAIGEAPTLSALRDSVSERSLLRFVPTHRDFEQGVDGRLFIDTAHYGL